MIRPRRASRRAPQGGRAGVGPRAGEGMINLSERSASESRARRGAAGPRQRAGEGVGRDEVPRY
jgi:hypothetical protein